MRLLERPRPDELLTSCIVRTARAISFPVGDVLRNLRGTKKGPSPGLLSFPYIHEMAAAWRTTPQLLIWHHTMLPYATAFLHEAAYRRTMENALSSADKRVGIGAVTQSTTAYVRVCRFCRACAEQDVATWGNSYWHRAHHLPGVLVCPQHGCPLVLTNISTVSRALIEILPHQVNTLAPSWSPSSFELLLAQASVAALNRRVGPAAEPTAASYRSRMVNAGLLSEGRHTDMRRLRAWFADSIKGDQLQRVLSNTDNDLRWIQRLLVNGQCAQNPATRHLLFATLIEASQPPTRPLLDFSSVGVRRSRMVEMDARFAAAAKKVALKAIRSGERIKVCDVLQQLGCWSSYRHRRQDFPKLQAFVTWLKSSPACMRPNWGRGGTPRAQSVMRMKP